MQISLFNFYCFVEMVHAIKAKENKLYIFEMCKIEISFDTKMHSLKKVFFTLPFLRFRERYSF